MTTRKQRIHFALVAAAIASAPGCGADLPGADRELDEPGALEFRGDDCNPLLASCSYRNSFYLGLEEYGIDNLPLVPNSDPDISITEIIAYRCFDSQGALVEGTYHVIDPTLSVDAYGNFGAMVFEDVADPRSTCTVEGRAWVGTEWLVTANAESSIGQLDTIDAKLRIASANTADGQSTLYRWETDHDYLYGVPSHDWRATCDEDPDMLLDFHAVVYPYLRVDEQTGVFGTDPDTAYLGCTSGMIAKSSTTRPSCSSPTP